MMRLGYSREPRVLICKSRKDEPVVAWRPRHMRKEVATWLESKATKPLCRDAVQKIFVRG
jgi:hypothetical protein